MSTASLQDRRAAVDAYAFDDVHPHVRFGTASDRYGGWLGQIYPPEQYADRVSTRSRRMGGESFTERRVPIESVRDYFQHFQVLEIDFTFYRPLLEDDDEPGSNYHVLSNYAEHAPDDASFLLKAPKIFRAQSPAQRRVCRQPDVSGGLGLRGDVSRAGPRASRRSARRCHLSAGISARGRQPQPVRKC